MDVRELMRLVDALGARVAAPPSQKIRTRERHRRDLLVEWRERRKTERAAAARQQRPPFRVGVPSRELAPKFPSRVNKNKKKAPRGRKSVVREAANAPVTAGHSSIAAGFHVSPERSTRYFKLQLDNEATRLRGLCDQWRQFAACETLEDEHQATIDAAIGQTQLLVNKKFQQFKGLINKCENQDISEGEGKVNIDDLQGFWDMMYMQVENVDIRFNKLETLKANDWKDESFTVKKSKIQKSIKKKKILEGTKGSSKLKAAILAAKQRLKEQQSEEMNDNLVVRKSLRNISSTNDSTFPDKTPVKSEQGFLNVAVDLTKTPSKSILKSPVNRTSIERRSAARKNKMKVLFSQDLSLSNAGTLEKSSSSSKKKLRSQKMNTFTNNDENISPHDMKSPLNRPLRRSHRLSEKSPLFEIS